jgi:hypothetical protein
LEVLSPIGRCNFDVSGQYLYQVLILEVLKKHFQQFLQPNAPNYNDTLMKIELQLTWTIIVVSSVISGKSKAYFTLKNQNATGDALLVLASFEILLLSDRRIKEKGINVLLQLIDNFQ